MANLEDWIGRSQTFSERMDASALGRLAHALDRREALVDGDPLPPLFHYCTHVVSVPRSRLGIDGHPERGRFIPPIELPRRMWAGSRLRFTGDIRVGDVVTKTSTIASVTEKRGRSGPLVFVTVDHELAVDDEVRISEQQDLVYRDHPAPGDRPPGEPAPPDHDWTRPITPDPVFLFQYSALSHNAHRIHYDRDYAVDVEGYEGLVVHGPLIATLLADLAVSESGRSLTRFSFRARSPLFDGAPFDVSGRVTPDGADLWATNPSGELAMTAEAEFR